MGKLINELSILNDETSIFSDKNVQYIVPLYQRAFAWEDKEISQLIEDIRDFIGDSYYIGSVIVSKGNDGYEVIDGQQRLTALFLLLHSLNIGKMETTLSFACREKSNYTLKNLKNLILDERVEPSLQNGKSIIETIINDKEFNKKEFIEQLKKVKLYRIEVPKNTDLNRYFEIMNTRGEQLEQHDILKANLMSKISNKNAKELFAKIWDACSDMTGYVQMNFDTKTRHELFGKDWCSLPKVSFDLEKVVERSTGYTIKNIINTSFKVESIEENTEIDKHVRFESIISFPFFLLHTLKVYIANEQEFSPNTIYFSLDDKKLIDTFNKAVKNSESFSMNFIEYLLKCRFLFDKYILKREYIYQNSDGEWSLKELKRSTQTNKTPYYSNTYFGDKNNNTNIMLQSCLRVSYTSPKNMSWITTLLIWLYNEENIGEIDNFEIQIENIIKNYVTENYLNDKNYSLGTNTPHIVFNYLDYLLWRGKDNSKEFSNFTFEFRNSVEHWYPQNPSEGTFEKWNSLDDLNSFGNLCLIQRNINSKFSNMAPVAKASNFERMIEKGSLKLRIMKQLTCSITNEEWKTKAFKEHGDKMLEILKKACGVS